MNELDDILRQATAAIPEPYFRMPIFEDVPVYRERVYTYELYHQMRVRWPVPCPFLLGGEVDKSGHAALSRLGVEGQKPDLLVHWPGDMTRNYAIIEVKPVNRVFGNAQKDLETLALFRRDVGYRRAIYLIFGGGNNRNTLEHIREIARGVPNSQGIELWRHNVVGQPAARLADIGAQD